jgi:hypothetical protein
MCPRAGLDNVEKGEFCTLPGLELRPLGRAARSQSLYRLRYAGSPTNHEYFYYYLLTAIGLMPSGSVYNRDIQST